MPTKWVKTGRRSGALVTFQLDWKPGDLPPKDRSDYLGRQAWGEVQHKAGLRPTQCGRCALWGYPQEMSSTLDKSTAHTRAGRPVQIESHVCTDCNNKGAKT